MYNTYDFSKIFYLYDTQEHKEYLFEDKKKFIEHISKKYYDYCHFPQRWKFFDGAGRSINPIIYSEEVELYLKKYKNSLGNFNTKKRVKNKKYMGIFRKTPVSNLHEYWNRRLPRKNAKMRHILLMWSKPEYKEYNRGNHFPYWYDRNRKTERNWKSQRKHQWK